MALSAPAQRRHLHTRTIHCEGFERDDGLFDIEARVVDTKTYPMELFERGVVAPGESVHDMELRLTVDLELVVRDIEVAANHGPHPECKTVAPAYRALIGAQLTRGWRQAVHEAVGGDKGCTHLRELLMPAATVAFQTSTIRSKYNAGAIMHGRFDPDAPPPRFVGACKAWATDSKQVQRHFPLHYKPKAPAVA